MEEPRPPRRPPSRGGITNTYLRHQIERLGRLLDASRTLIGRPPPAEAPPSAGAEPPPRGEERPQPPPT